MAVADTTRVYLEIGKKKVFAAANDWPGWARSGRDEERALEALAAYLPRYALVVRRAGLTTPRDVFVVTERVAGTTATDFGVLEKVTQADYEEMSAGDAKQLAALVNAAWDEFAEIVAGTPEELTKGPRGGGRDRTKMTDHVIGAEASYAAKLGVKHKRPAVDDAAAIAALRDDILTVLGQPSDGLPVRERGWPTRYAARRIAWHVLDHAWEMQDRTP